ncbi:GbsR/MarR family transcriptional regulator [Virgibacillus sp. NKC19-16]|uniref:choline uptake/conversion transcriptional regulator CudC n=1 Tax=Virgibacillus salidurans TaxID=2831673 RepID=UPI001F397CD4|nr:GbsR/MarR family transcriptional regulator [Virgibacillus sp. NKC19-16]UJL45733.1 GbsR/MarR family transcriptional regulator [Virgibacillus sp. NKC19-16]
MEHNPESNQASAAEKINQAEDKMINTIAETMDLYGVTPSVGRLYATLYFQHEPMTLDGMKDKLGMSKPSMSTSVRKLQDIDIVQKVWQKGTRKDFFVAEKDYFQYFKKFFCKKWERETNMFLGSIDYAQKQLAEVLDQPEIEEHLQQKAQLDYDQLEEARKYYHWLQRLIRSIESNEIYDYLPKEKPEDI